VWDTPEFAGPNRKVPTHPGSGVETRFAEPVPRKKSRANQPGFVVFGANPLARLHMVFLKLDFEEF